MDEDAIVGLILELNVPERREQALMLLRSAILIIIVDHVTVIITVINHRVTIIRNRSSMPIFNIQHELLIMISSLKHSDVFIHSDY